MRRRGITELVGVNFKGMIGSRGVITIMDPSTTPMGQVIRDVGKAQSLVSTARKQGAGTIVIADSSCLILDTLRPRAVTQEFTRVCRGRSGKRARRWEGFDDNFQVFQYEGERDGRAPRKRV